MKRTINFYEFERAFIDLGRENSFSYEGKKALFDYLEELEEDMGTELELDVVALCGEYSEYADLDEIKEQYEDVETIEDLQDMTEVIEFDGGIIIYDYF